MAEVANSSLICKLDSGQLRFSSSHKAYYNTIAQRGRERKTLVFVYEYAVGGAWKGWEGLERDGRGWLGKGTRLRNILYVGK